MANLPAIPGLDPPPTSWPGSGFKGGITPTDWTQERIDAYRQQITELLLRQVVLALRGLLNPGKAFDQLRNWADNLGGEITDQIRDEAGIDLSSWEAFIASLDDGEGIDLPFITDFISGAQQFFGDIDFTAPDFDPQVAAREFVRTVVQPFLNIISRIVPALFGPLPIGMLTDERITLLLEGGFDDAVTIVEGSGYEHDPDDGATTPLGCAVVDLDGQWHLLATEPVRVAPGWVLKAGSKVKYIDVEAAPESNAIRIELVPYNGTEAGEPVWMASDESPEGTWDWDDLNSWAEYTVPATGVTHVGLQLVTSDEGTAGRVKWDNVFLQSTEKIPQAFTKDLPEDLASLLNFVRTWVESALAALGIDPSGNLLDDILDLSDEIEWIRDRAQQGFDDAATALADLGELAGNLLTNPAAVLGEIGQDLVTGLPTALGNLETTLNQIGEVFDGVVVTPVNSIVQAVKDWWNSIAGKTQNLNSSGKLDASNLVGQVAADAVEGLTDLTNDVVGGFKGIFDSWFGGNSGTGTATEVAQTIEAIKDAVISGYTVSTFTSSEAGWQRPDGLIEMIAVVVGGGENGPAGVNNTGTSVRPGGLHGSYLAQTLDVTTLPAAFDIAVGTAGQRSYIREANASPHSGTVIVESPAHGSPGGIATAFGLSQTNSVPGNGGTGGMAYNPDDPPAGHSATAGTAGSPSGLAAGGTGGNAASGSSSGTATGGSGGTGGTVSAGALTKCGGGGGGGGGGGRSFGFTGGSGGNGGAGGYPGGAGGAGGNGSGVLGGTAGSGGPGAAGVVWLFYR
ncbi:minor tail protein [Mycobacterium phage Phayonce]|uniref:Minor tail protein n=1 Tax=Mycobacterium phage Phayonce TaxID=1647302 RepID=A0A0F6YQH8_9CAUD|nr:minor tail protein [Mycobacterium phage Phayonce]AKF14380.1 minor tail protein [Mycobacterium phage Phayonce]